MDSCYLVMPLHLAGGALEAIELTRNSPRRFAVSRIIRGGPGMTGGALIVQSDKTLLLEVDHPDADAARRDIAPFAELERAPSTFTPIASRRWRCGTPARLATTPRASSTLMTHSRYPVPHALLVDIADSMDRYGRLRLLDHPAHGLVLEALDIPVLEEVLRSRKVAPLVGSRIDETLVAVHPSEQGPPQAGAAEAGLAGRGSGRLCRRRGASDRAGRDRLDAS